MNSFSFARRASICVSSDKTKTFLLVSFNFQWESSQYPSRGNSIPSSADLGHLGTLH